MLLLYAFTNYLRYLMNYNMGVNFNQKLSNNIAMFFVYKFMALSDYILFMHIQLRLVSIIYYYNDVSSYTPF